MHKLSGHVLEPESQFAVRRTGLASFLFAIVCPRDAKAAVVSTNALILTYRSWFREIPFGEIDRVEEESAWCRASIRICHASGDVAVSGLLHDDAKSLSNALENARVEWWRFALMAQIGTLRSVHDRLAQLANPSKYLTQSDFRDLKHDAERIANEFLARWPNTLSNTSEIRMLKSILELLEAPDRFRVNANEKFVANELIRSREFFDRVEVRPLSDEQRKAVVIDEARNLVVAAAGSGKTSVMVAKAGWLSQRGFRRPSELLLLAFTRDARKELEERLRKRLGDETVRGVTVRTFHSLGMAIIGEAEGKRPMLAQTAEDNKALTNQLKDIVIGLLSEQELSETLVSWFQNQFAPYKSEHECRNWGEYWDYIRRHDIRSLKGERVKSYEECEIANFLYLNAVPYEYEASYAYDTATSEKRQYKPDFHLPDAGVWIEHFGINADGKTAPFVNEEEYLQEMDWKRRIHAEHGTTLIETFSYERAAGKLTKNLAAKLRAHGVTLSLIGRDQMFAVLEMQGRIDPFIQLVANFLQHYKGAQVGFGELTQRAAKSRGRFRAEAFLAVFKLVFERYQNTLSQSGEIDFHDMINKATEHVEAGLYSSPFNYILVDEFQDISPARARLLRALLDQSPSAQLFAVGDDWQAIYRFGGSDIAIMREFGERFGDNERVDLETTFRCSNRITSVATEFILRNPTQIRKTVRSTHKTDRPSVHVGVPNGENLSLLWEALDRIADNAVRYDEKSTVLLLGRYRHMRPQNLTGLAKRYPNLRFFYMTIHGSKGIEADYVVVLGLCTGKYGFPSEITDDPLLDLVLAAPEEHPNAEERRLFYVAITRARREVFLLAEGGSPSPFAKELIEGGYDVTVFGRPLDSDVSCPVCVNGRLERRENARSRGVFYSCSNWPYCEYTQRPCPNCGQGLPIKVNGNFRCRDCSQSIKICPSCDGWLESKMGIYGRFLGCVNWPACNYTRNIGK